MPPPPASDGRSATRVYGPALPSAVGPPPTVRIETANEVIRKQVAHAPSEAARRRKPTSCGHFPVCALRLAGNDVVERNAGAGAILEHRGKARRDRVDRVP